VEERVVERRWRVSPAGRVAAGLVCLLFLLLGISLVLDGAAADDRIEGIVMLVAAPLSSWLFAWRPYASLSTDSVVIQNPLRRHVIPLGAVMGAHSEYSGVSIKVRGRGRPLGVWAVQKTNLSVWRGRSTRADALAKEIMDAK